jgi:hypothetical protein
MTGTTAVILYYRACGQAHRISTSIFDRVVGEKKTAAESLEILRGGLRPSTSNN